MVAVVLIRFRKMIGISVVVPWIPIQKIYKTLLFEYALYVCVYVSLSFIPQEEIFFKITNFPFFRKFSLYETKAA